MTYTNEDADRFHYRPDSLVVTVDVRAWRATHPTIDALRLDVPLPWVMQIAAWRALAPEDDVVTWVVYPRGPLDRLHVVLRVIAYSRSEVIAAVATSLPVTVHGRSRFDPTRHAVPIPNRAVGRLVQPDMAVFRRTYGLVLLPRAFFAGLYRAVVSLGSDGSAGARGGLCTGLARLSLERSLTSEPATPDIEDVLVWHGRQLTDRALLAGLPWFVFPSPRRAFERFRADLYARGWSDVCFDIGVPRPARRDVVTALLREGHTVVPYAYQQVDETRAQVLVHDPNDVPGPTPPDAVIEFDLRSDTYSYRHLVQPGDTRTTVVAVRQRPYREGRTAVLASLANLVLFPKSIGASMPQLRGRVRPGVALAAGVAVAGGLLGWRRRARA